MRSLEMAELADLQTLTRAFCDADNLRQKAFAQIASGFAADPQAREDIKKSVDLFLTHWNKKVAARSARDLEFIIGAINQRADATRASRSRDLRAIVQLLLSDPHYRKSDQWLSVVSDIERFKCGELKKWEEKKRADKKRGANTNSGLSRNVYLAFSQLAEDLAALDRDINLADRRIDRVVSENSAEKVGAAASEVGSAFVLVRKSSSSSNKFVVHGLNIAPHIMSSTLLYASEKYPLADGTRRKAQGICFFDGRYLVAVVRARSDACFTFVTGLIGNQDQKVGLFEALISTTNRKEQRISAKALCLRCEDRSEQRSKIGVFGEKELLSKYGSDQRCALADWITKEKQGVLQL